MQAYEVCLEELVRAIKESDLYQDYHLLLRQLQQDAALYEQLCQFRKKRFEIKSNEESEDALVILEQEFSELLQQSDIQRFLKIECKLAKMARQITSMLLQSFELDLDFL